MYKAFIFDLDGTLLNTIEDLTISINYALKKNNLPTYTVNEVKYLVGSGIKVLVERAIKTHTEKFEDVYKDFLDYYKDHNMDKTCLYDGVFETIKCLYEKGIKMAIVSNKYDEGVKAICKPLFHHYIDVMIGESNGLNKKPSSDMVEFAIDKLNITKDHVAYVGDSDIDYLTAKNSSLDFIGAAYGFRDRKFLEDLGAKIVIDEFSELKKYI